MASACVNNIGVSPERFKPYSWLSPRMSLSLEEQPSKPRHKSKTVPSLTDPEPAEIQAAAAAGDFEFRLEDPVTNMLPADELFSNGKLLPLHLSSSSSSLEQQQNPLSSDNSSNNNNNNNSTQTVKSCRALEMDPYLFSPRAPRCSSRWRELLGLKKSNQNQNQPTKTDPQGTKSLKQFLHKTSKSSSSSSSSSLNTPLLKELNSDYESISISSSRLSLSSSSSSHEHEHEDLPRLSLDSDKPSPNPFAPCRTTNLNPPRMRMVKPRAGSVSETNCGGADSSSSSSTTTTTCRGVSVSVSVSADSPRMNSSGKIVFQSLERSSSSPSSFNGGPRYKHRGMERSHSANVVRITPVLNMPVCSLRGSSKSGSGFGFGQLFSSSQKTGNGGSNSSNKGRQCNSTTTSRSLQF